MKILLLSPNTKSIMAFANLKIFSLVSWSCFILLSSIQKYLPSCTLKIFIIKYLSIMCKNCSLLNFRRKYPKKNVENFNFPSQINDVSEIEFLRHPTQTHKTIFCNSRQYLGGKKMICIQRK